MAHTKPNELRSRLVGVNVIMVTPFDENEEIDIKKVRELTNYLIDNGIKEGSGVIIATGSMGECFAMNPEERKGVFRAIIEEARGRVPVVVACNETSTRTVIDLCQSAQDADADGVMVMPPYYLPPTDEEILGFYDRLSQNIDIGIVIYNAPAVSVDIPLKTLQELADMEKMVGLKDVTNDCTKFMLTVRKLGKKLALLNGVGEILEPSRTAAGTIGFFTYAGNFAPELTLDLWRTCRNGDYEKAKILSNKFTPLFEFQIEFRKPIQATKNIMRDMGLMGGYSRSPLTPLTEEEEYQVGKIMAEMGLV